MTCTTSSLAGTALVVVVLLASLGCAALKLNGCRRVDQCGEHRAYVCGADVVCADRNGNTIRSEPAPGRAVGCRICDGQS